MQNKSKDYRDGIAEGKRQLIESLLKKFESVKSRADRNYQKQMMALFIQSKKGNMKGEAQLYREIFEGLKNGMAR